MLYLILRFNFILRLSVTLTRVRRAVSCGSKPPVFRFRSGVLRVIHRRGANGEEVRSLFEGGVRVAFEGTHLNEAQGVGEGSWVSDLVRYRTRASLTTI